MDGNSSFGNERKADNKKRGRHFNVRTLFIILMLAYPVLHFLVMWVFVNGYSIVLSFQRYFSTIRPAGYDKGWNFVGFDNFKNLFNLIKSDENTREMFANSLMYPVISCLVTLPLSIIAAYFMYKKVAGSAFFRVVFFFPSIVPLIILTLIYRYSVAPDGLVNVLLQKLHILEKGEIVSFLNVFGEDTAAGAVYIFCIWAGIGYNIILLNSGMGKIPQELQESAMLDGAGPMTELFRIVIPLTWPTITTMFILGMMSCINVYMQPKFLTMDKYGKTVAWMIYDYAQGGRPGDLGQAASLGLFCTVILAPTILLVKHFLEKCFADVDF